MCGAATAATCPPTDGGLTRDITLVTSGTTTATISCYAYGDGNFGNGQHDAILGGNNQGNPFTLLGTPISGLLEVNDSGDSNTSFLSGDLNAGNFGIVTVGQSIASQFQNLLLGFKFGKPQQHTPDWAVFSISNAGSYRFEQSINQGEFSHTVLYGTPLTTPTTTPVPLPAGLVLLLSGLAAFSVMRRKGGAPSPG